MRSKNPMVSIFCPTKARSPRLLTRWAWDEARRYLGEDRVVELPIRMTGEDFAFYTHHLPACFYRLGIGNTERGINSPVHTDTFDVDEACLETGSGLMAWLALGRLGGEVG